MRVNNSQGNLESKANFRILLGLNLVAWMVGIVGGYCSVVQQQGSISEANYYIANSFKEDFKGLDRVPLYALLP